MRSYILTAFCLFLIFSGFSSAFVFALAYMWVDLFSPQQVTWSFLNQLPISMIMAMFMLGAYVFFDRKAPPKFVFAIKLILLWAIWVTLTTLWAEVPISAWEKWNWAIKTILFSAFIPFIIRSQIQIEAMILTMVLSLSGTIVAAGAKTLATGGGYNLNLGLIQGNSGLAEGATQATVVIAVIPMILWIVKHSQIIAGSKLLRACCYALIGGCVLTALGTFQRTALVVLAVLGCYLWLRSKHKLVFGSIGVIAVLIAASIMVGGQWASRMATIDTYQTETSALTRIAVWMWTTQYALAHPAGGGFGVYLINSFRVPIGNTGEFLDIKGRAFHSIWFEVLGEQGIVGIIIFLGLIFCAFKYFWRVQRRTRDLPDRLWLRDLAFAMAASTAIYLAGGTFVGIAFQPFFYYCLGCAISLHQYVARTEKAEQPLVGSQKAGALGGVIAPRPVPG